MTWRRIAPWVIGLIALLTIFINLPRQTLGLDWLPREVAGLEFRTVLGLDLQGGQRVTLEVLPQIDQEITEEDVEVARDIIERRVAGIGVTEP
jgi:preprotein translocase subunit SecD